MTNRNKLAVVIPAYKSAFLYKALSSLSAQTVKNFNVYIGDDGSPEGIEHIVNEFTASLNIKYHRFHQNLGGQNLVAQWQRSIDLCKDEEWVWLFSDDDMMSSNCVEMILKSIERYPSERLFHINVNIIDENDVQLHPPTPFPQFINAKDIFVGKIQLRLSSTVVEYIFRKDLYLEKGGFEFYDLAWGSDDATWIKFIGFDRLRTIPECTVYWRYSRQNISSIQDNFTIVLRKVNANLKFVNWAKYYFQKDNVDLALKPFEIIKWIMQNFKDSKKITYRQMVFYTWHICKELNCKYLFFTSILYLQYSWMKRVLNLNT
jgi:glycosyltransferase involved in cell wall biosynthesis